MSDTVAISYTFVGDHVFCPKKKQKKKKKKRDWRPIGSWGFGSSIGDLANTARLFPVLYCAAGPFINHGLVHFSRDGYSRG